jgi:hypothetical protein
MQPVSLWVRRALTAGFGVSVALGGLGATRASAAPSNPKSAISGPFTCGPNPLGPPNLPTLTGTFVVNSGKSTATTWTSAHLNFDGGGTGVFHPNAFLLNGGPLVFKNGQPDGPWFCSITGFDQSGTEVVSGLVAGNITFNG